ncbi:alpha-glycosyltransferase/ family 4 [Synechococcus sp. A15-127]|uniref:glycosyltransferase n=1 Tax=Synechococcus sp. A15-127 TaxID=1050624 RepID=UPI001648BD0F|nr:glycosyltransferase [Synechococcus sp. A15-127]QNI93303.1 alpha-glycosyltransferase/ family 4 [Synechococcus sp. A15-127]
MAIRLVRFLVPGTSGRFRCGGLSVELQTARLVASLCETEIVTYRERRDDVLFLDDLLRDESPSDDVLWIVSWGFDVPGLIRRLRGHRVAYHAHSSGYGFDVPPGIGVLAVSRNTLGYWGDRAPRNPLFLVPNALEQSWLDRGDRGDASGRERPIDVLVQARKSSDYVLQRLVPALRQRGLSVEVQSGWVEDLVGLFNNSKVYLYDSAEYWRGRGVSEGFGLPPLEAMACGCVVFSSLNHALADHCDPGRSAHQIGCGSLAHDLQRIQAAVAEPRRWRPPMAELGALLQSSGEQQLLERWRQVLSDLDQLQLQWQQDDPLSSPSTWRLRLAQMLHRARRVVDRLPGWPKRS